MSESWKDGCFTLAFDGDIRNHETNPFKTKTPFGVPVAAGIGNLFQRANELELSLEECVAVLDRNFMEIGGDGNDVLDRAKDVLNSR